MGALILIFIIGLIFTKINCQTRPNIIFILADDLGWNDVGFHGSNQIPTPNIDALAYTGIILNNYYVTPVCTPSRSALMTGKYPIHTGLQHGVIHGSAPYGLSLNETLLPQYLKQKGYVTRAVGKWHLGMQHEVIFGDQPWGLGLSEKILPQYLKEKGYVTRAVGKWHLGHFKHQYLPEARGFDSHYGYWVGHQDYYDHTAIKNLGYWGYDMRRGMNITWSDYGSYSTDLFTKEAVKIIQQHDSEKPLFLYLAHLATHSANAYRPLQAPAETIAKFNYIKDKNRRIFAAMVSKLDDSVGSVVEALFNAGMLENSVIIFSTDNGGPAAGFNLNAASNWPLRGVKDTLWEGGVRGASFVWSPRLLQPKVSNTMMHITDWLPTILSLIDEERNVGIESSKKYSKSLSKIPGLDGLDLKSSLFGNQPSPRHEILLNIDNERKIASLRVKNWKLIKGRTWNGTYDKWFGPSGRDSSYNWDALYYSSTSKVLTFIQKPLPSQNKIEEIRSQANVDCNDSNEISVSDREQDVFLFNLDEDPCEKNNLAKTELKILNLMEKRLQYYTGTVVPPRNKPADPRSNPKYWGYAWINWMDFI